MKECDKTQIFVVSFHFSLFLHSQLLKLRCDTIWALTAPIFHLYPNSVFLPKYMRPGGNWTPDHEFYFYFWMRQPTTDPLTVCSQSLAVLIQSTYRCNLSACSEITIWLFMALLWIGTSLYYVWCHGQQYVITWYRKLGPIYVSGVGYTKMCQTTIFEKRKNRRNAAHRN